MNKIILLILTLGLCIIISGCATFPELTPYDIRAIESKDLRSSYDNAYRATLTVLQDEGFMIINSDYQGGVVVATTGRSPGRYLSPGEREDKPNAIDILDLLFGSRRNTSGGFDVNVTIEKYTDEITKMRMVINQHIYDKDDRRTGSERVYKPEVLQEYYTAIQNEIFMRKQLQK